ncbi:sigma-70 family RNA polymerase sigma factor [Sphingobacterium oryzagri]|uniref:Sigma-70 family RNA polymerase sigma factor n=1 Tax=Sphingobacterium oryzagri TaxID=3025669 RepID=A0ABY7WG55_9SPHI|nr:sigma-70 family RNA polymerase sigma factor [Sphingobacterium sp. KACC 22765]WDF68602.1 sigma-70 family RNA polymerase sigma factor [Sphingobacterium sp. KACC 22765]
MNKNLEIEFVNLLEENQNILHKICRLYAEDLEAHKDLFQEMVIQLWHSFPTFKGDSKFSTWAYRVALNTAISLYRTKKRRISTVELDHSLQNIHYEEYNDMQEEQLRFLYRAVRQLNDIEKALVYMYLEDKDYQEIAETLGISEVNARVKMNRIKTKLKDMLNQQGGI